MPSSISALSDMEAIDDHAEAGLNFATKRCQHTRIHGEGTEGKFERKNREEASG